MEVFTMKNFFNRMTEWRPIRAIVESIRNKLLFWFLVLSVIPLVALGITAFYTASTSLNEKAFAQLEALQTSRSTTIQNYFAERQGDMGVLVEIASTLRQEAFDKLSVVQERKASEIKTWVIDRTGDALFARNLVVVKGTVGVNEGIPVLSEYKNDKSNPAYVEAFTRAENVLGAFAEEIGSGVYDDIMLADLEGDIVFALDPKSRGISEADSIEFQNGLKDLYVGDIVFLSEHNAYSLQITAPVKDNRGKTVGVLFLEPNIGFINNIMQDRTGLGQTGETYLVGKVGDQNELRSNRVVKEGNIGDPKPGADTDKALAGLSGQEFKVGSAGDYEVSVFTPLDIPNQNWAIIATIGVAEILAPTIEGAEKDMFANYIEQYGYYDLFLFEPNGYLFYSVAHESDYQTNMLTGPYKDSNLGGLVAEILVDKEYKLVDYAKYAPSQDAPAAFIGQPILGNDGEVELIVALQLPLDQISAVMQESVGLGESGETYLVGQDFKWRSDSRFLDQLGVESTVLSDEFLVNTVGAQSALAGNSGIQVINDYRGVSVLSSWSPLILDAPDENHPEGIKWAVLAEIDQAEVQQPVITLALITTGLVVGAIILVVVVALLLSGALTRQINAIMDLFGEIGMGDFDARTEVVSQDELGEMAESLNAMLDNTLALVQTSEERDSMQASMMTLLDEISGIAEGDLTREAEVKADITGAVADAFNFTILQLRDIIGNVQHATHEVSSSAGDIQTTAEHLAEGSESQAAQILETSTAIEEMSVSIQQVSENAIVSATVAEQALANAQQGTKAVHDTIEGMDRIRDQVQETSKRIKRLGESSQEIGEIVQVISDIADRTSILALNASIQAAMAGEAGRGFAVVAEEVERLAERSADATKQIEGLVKTIQSETTETVTAMEDSTREVVEGSQLANEAGRALGEIETVSNRLAELIQSISMASKQQARGSEAVASSMSDIAEVTQETAAGTKQASVSISDLAVLADNLRGSVSTFKLPSTNGQGA